MIYISQGHQRGIGLETFFKAASLLQESERHLLAFVGSRPAMDETLKSLSLKPNLKGLKHIFFAPSSSSESYQSLQVCLDRISPRDILITLPTSKDQLPHNKGHTEFFRHFYRIKELPMVFESLKEKMLLLTDHIPLREVGSAVSQESVFVKVATALRFYSAREPIREVLFAGVNPHAGEGGLLGDEENILRQGIDRLRGEFPEVVFQGPFSGDTLHFYRKSAVSQLNVYTYHDQGLSLFKGKNGLMGINLTLGLPFLRLSVDHGTGFNLYKRDCADYMGMYHVLIRAVELANEK